MPPPALRQWFTACLPAAGRSRWLLRWIPGACLALAFVAASACLAQEGPATRPGATQPASQRLLGEPTRLTLKLVDAAPFDAFKALEAASGVTLRLPTKETFERHLDRRVTLDLEETSWLEAAVAIADQANARLSYYGGSWNVGFGGAPRATPRRDFIGPLLATCNRVIIDRQVLYGSPERRLQTVTLTGSLLAEPRIQSLQLGDCTFLEGTDDQGRPLRAAPVDQAIAVPRLAGVVASGESREFTLALELPAADAKSIRHIKAMLQIGVLTRSESLEFPDVLNSEGARREVGGSLFTLERIEQSAGQSYELHFKVSPSSLPAGFHVAARSNQPPFQPSITLVDGAGAGGHVRVSRTTPHDDGLAISLIVLIAPQPRNPLQNGDPAKADGPGEARPTVNLSWQLPMAYERIDVPVEFKDIPLPR